MTTARVPRDLTPETASFDVLCAADPANETARLLLAADLKAGGFADVAVLIAGPDGERLARMASEAGAGILAAAECVTGRFGGPDLAPEHVAVFSGTFLAHRRQLDAEAGTWRRAAGAVRDVLDALAGPEADDLRRRLPNVLPGLAGVADELETCAAVAERRAGFYAGDPAGTPSSEGHHRGT